MTLTRKKAFGRTTALTLTFVMAGLMASAASAQNSPVAVDVHAGTTGIGIGARYQLSEVFVLRADYDHLDYSRDFNSDDVDYDGTLNFKPFTFAVDVHPFRNSFFVSAGYTAGDRNIDLKARPSGDTNIGGTIFTPTEIGTLTATADMGNGAPFVGLGFDNAFNASGSLSFRFLVGAVLGDDPEVTMTSDGTYANLPIYQQALENERRELQEDVKEVKTWPVLQVGLSWRF